jgi:tRNA-binding protein
MSDAQGNGDPAWTTGDHGEAKEPEHAPPLPDLRVARILEAKPHPNADRLLVVQVDAGEPMPRQLVAGIAGKYLPEELTGKHVVIVANLQPAKLRGETSQGMLLAVESEGVLGLVLAPDAAPGTHVRTAAGGEPGDQITIDDFKRHEILASAERVTFDGAPVVAPRLVVDRGVSGRAR